MKAPAIRINVSVPKSIVSKLIDRIDLMRDEFMRIKACPGCTDEIRGLCDRAVKSITRNISVIDERDAAIKTSNLALSACHSIKFATENAARHGGDYSLNDLLAADLLAREALGKKARKS